METRNNPEELASALVGFAWAALLFLLGCIWNGLTNNF